MEKEQRIEEILKPNTSGRTISNAMLIDSLNNTNSAGHEQNKNLAPKQQFRKQNNVKILKNGQAGVTDSTVVGENNQLRTVQSNKNLKYTRRAVIVRNNREHLPRTIIAKTMNVLSFVAVALVGVFLGSFMGNMFIASKTAVDYSSLVAADYELTTSDYATIYAANKDKDASSVNAVNSYAMAIWQTRYDSEIVSEFSVVGQGSVRAKVSGISQSQQVVKNVTKTADELIIENITKGLISTAERSIWKISENSFTSFVTGNVDGNPPSATYADSPNKVYDLNNQSEFQEYKDEYGQNYYDYFPYIVSEKTVDSSSFIGEENGGYKYKIELNKITSVINYVRTMMHTSNLNRAPTFSSIEVEFIVDENYRFKEFHIYENYTIYYLGLPADCTSELHFIFSY